MSLPLRRLLAPTAALALLSSCGVGRIYTHITEPLDVNYDRTPVGGPEGFGSGVKHYSVRSVDFQWDSNAIGDIARRHDMEEVYYADLETQRFLGFFGLYTVHVYGR